MKKRKHVNRLLVRFFFMFGKYFCRLFFFSSVRNEDVFEREDQIISGLV